MEKKAEPRLVVGMTGGQATNSYVAGQVEGGMGNTYHSPQHHVDKAFQNNVSGSSGVTTVNEVTGDTVNIGSGSSPTQQPAPQASSTNIRNMKVTGVAGNAQVDSSVVVGINEGQMGTIENRQQTYNIENAQGIVGGQDMRGATVDQRGVAEGRSGHSAYFRGKELSDVTEEDIAGLLQEKNLAKHIPLFQKHCIDGDLLSQLTDNELKDFGISDSFERKKILNLRKCLPKQ